MEDQTVREATVQEMAQEITSYHKPDDSQIIAISNVRVAAMNMIIAIVENCPSSPDRSAAIRKVREAMMTANASIVVTQISF